jgi:hypothetical protein
LDYEEAFKVTDSELDQLASLDNTKKLFPDLTFDGFLLLIRRFKLNSPIFPQLRKYISTLIPAKRKAHLQVGSPIPKMMTTMTTMTTTTTTKQMSGVNM